MCRQRALAEAFEPEHQTSASPQAILLRSPQGLWSAIVQTFFSLPYFTNQLSETVLDSESVLSPAFAK
jgi:hypothetical protein